MSKIMTMRQAITEHVPDGASVALGLQMEQMIPFAAGHERGLRGRRGGGLGWQCNDGIGL